MPHDDGADDSNRLAPVIDLFGGRRGRQASPAPSLADEPAPGFPARGADGLAKARAALEEITAASKARRTSIESPADAPPAPAAADSAGWWVDDGSAEDSLGHESSVGVPDQGSAIASPADPPQKSASLPGRRARAESAAASRWGGGDDVDEQKTGPRLAIEEASTRALARRGLSVSELQQKLVAIGYEQAAVDAEIERMVAARYLDDVRLAEEIVRVEFERKGKGRAIVTAELRRRGVAPEDYLSALDEIDTDLELERAADIAYRKMSSSSDLDSRTAERRLSALLARRGFSGELARAAVARATERLANGD